MKSVHLLLSTIIAGTVLIGPGNMTSAEAGGVKIKYNHMVAKPSVKVKPNRKIKVRIKAPKVRVAPKKLQANSGVNDKPRIRRVNVAPSKPAGNKTNRYGIDLASLEQVPVPARAPRNTNVDNLTSAIENQGFDNAVGKQGFGFELAAVDPAQTFNPTQDEKAGKTVGGMDADQWNARFGSARNADDIASAMLGKYDRLGNRGADTPTNKWSDEFRPDPTRIEYGGLASDRTTVSEDGTETKTIHDDGSVSVRTTETHNPEGEGNTTETTAYDSYYDSSGELQSSSVSTTRQDADTGEWKSLFLGTYDWTTGQGVHYFETEGRAVSFDFEGDPETGRTRRHPVRGYDLDRTKTGEEENATPPPPNCGSASCNAARKGFSLRNNKKDGTRSDPGPDGAVPQNQTTSIIQYINRDDLVKNGVGENGNFAGYDNGAYSRLKNGGVRYTPETEM